VAGVARATADWLQVAETAACVLHQAVPHHECLFRHPKVQRRQRGCLLHFTPRWPLALVSASLTWPTSSASHRVGTPPGTTYFWRGRPCLCWLQATTHSHTVYMASFKPSQQGWRGLIVSRAHLATAVHAPTPRGL
jgi:hypothetical protein